MPVSCLGLRHRRKKFLVKFVRNSYAFLALCLLALAGLIVGAKAIFFDANQVDIPVDAAQAPNEVENDFHNDETTGNERLDQIKILVDQSIKTSSDKKRETLLELATENLAVQPELIPPFIEFFIMRNREEWHLNRGLRILQKLGPRRFYDTRRIVDLIKSDDFHESYRSSAIRCITVMSDKMDEAVLFDLLSDPRCREISGMILDCSMTALNEVTDRKKALRILRKCLSVTEGVSKEDLNVTLSSFIDSINGNEDVYAEALTEPLKPHEKLLAALSFLRETWPPENRYRKIAEDASKQSPLANAFLGTYLKLLE